MGYVNFVDISQYPNEKGEIPDRRYGLKNLTEVELGYAIQEKSHSSIIDARATMALYLKRKSLFKIQLVNTFKLFCDKLENKRLKWEQIDEMVLEYYELTSVYY